MSAAAPLDQALVQRLRSAIGDHIADDVDREAQLQLVLEHLAELRGLQAVLRQRIRQLTGEQGGEAA